MKRFICFALFIMLSLCSCGAKTDDPASKVTIKNTENTYGEIHYAIGFRKEDKTIAKAFDDALSEMISDGSIRKICENWIEKDITEYSDHADMKKGDDGSLYKAKEKGEIKVGIDPLGYPMSFRDANEQVCGIDADIIREISNRTGIGVKFVNVTSKNREAMLQKLDSSPSVYYYEDEYGKMIEATEEAEEKEAAIDCIIGGVAITDNSSETILFTRPYISTHLTLLVSEDMDENTALDVLTGKRIGVLENSYASDFVQKSGVEFFDIAEYESNYSGYYRLTGNKIHALLADEPFAYWAMSGKLVK